MARIIELIRRLGMQEHYGNPAAEYIAARSAAALSDLSGAGKVEVRGADRLKFLQGLLTSDFKALEPGESAPSALLDLHGKLRSLLDALVFEDRFLLELSGPAPDLIKALSRYIISDDVELADRTGDFKLYCLQGPAAPGLLGPKAPALEAHAELELEGVPVLAARTDEFGLPSYRLWVPAERAAGLWKALAAKALPLGAEAWETLRVEAGVPRFGLDVDESTLLMEVPSLEARVSYTKGCYLGQEIVARIKHRGRVNRRLMGLFLPGSALPEPGQPLYFQGQEAGRLGGAVRSLAFNRPLALALVKAEAGPGAELELGAPGGPKAVVAGLPFRGSPA